jgi:hypothetical protein
MNVYFCRQCSTAHETHLVNGPHCPDCGTANVGVLSDLHLGHLLGLDVYVSIQDLHGRTGYLFIKKPSGQVVIELQEEDFAIGKWARLAKQHPSTTVIPAK